MKKPILPIDTMFAWDEARDNHHGVEPIFTSDEIVACVGSLADRLVQWFETEPVANVIMNGSLMFAADLTRAMSARGMVMEMDFMTMKKDRRAGTVDILTASERPVKGRDVLVIDDIYESGRTITLARQHFEALGAQSVTFVVLLDKSNGRPVLDKPDFTGFKCPDIFVIGYGMDIGFRYRELPFIGRLGQA